jgi:hypothetical protein
MLGEGIFDNVQFELVRTVFDSVIKASTDWAQSLTFGDVLLLKGNDLSLTILVIPIPSLLPRIENNRCRSGI